MQRLGKLEHSCSLRICLYSGETGFARYKDGKCKY